MLLEKGSFSVFPANMCKGLPAYEQIVFIWLCHHSNAEGRCFPSLKTLSHECGLSKDSVIRSVKKLEERGFITKIIRKNDEGENISTLYTIVLSNANSDNLVADSDNTLVANSDNLVADSDTNYTNITKLKTYELNNISKPSVSRKKVKGVDLDTFTEEFETAWSFYPKRNGSNSKKAAYKQWSTRIKEGISYDALISATRNYHDLVTKNGNIGTPYVMQAQRFYGANKEFEQFINIDMRDLKNASSSNSGQYKTVTDRYHEAFNEVFGIKSEREINDNIQDVGGNIWSEMDVWTDRS